MLDCKLHPGIEQLAFSYDFDRIFHLNQCFIFSIYNDGNWERIIILCL